MPKEGPRQNLRPDRKDDHYNIALRSARVAAGLTQKDLAERIGVTAPLIANYERMRSMPGKDTKAKMVKTLAVEADKIFPKWIKFMTREVQNERGEEPVNYVQLGDISEDRLAVDYDGFVDPSYISDGVADAINTLDSRSRRIIRFRYGFGGGKAQTLEEIGRNEGLTRERIRQIETMALRKLRPLAEKLVC